MTLCLEFGFLCLEVSIIKRLLHQQTIPEPLKKRLPLSNLQ